MVSLSCATTEHVPATHAGAIYTGAQSGMVVCDRFSSHRFALFAFSRATVHLAMVLKFEVEYEAPLAPADMWSLRLDENFDHFCAATEGMKFVLWAPIMGYGLLIIESAHPGNNPDYFRL